jgi:hypothetical protein
MRDTNPYSTPATTKSQSVIADSPSTKRLWMAYGIAPFVAPMLAAIAIFATGFFYQSAHPEDVEVNPMSLMFAPVFLLTLGIPASYGVAGLIGMPITFWLRRRSILNGYTVHLAALAWAAILGSLMPVLGLPSMAVGANQSPGLLELAASGVVVFLLLDPFILLSATTFWLIGVRRRKPKERSVPMT